MTEWTWWQTWTFLPVLAIAFGLPLAATPAYLLGIVPLGDAFIAPWIGIGVASAWVLTVGRTVTA